MSLSMDAGCSSDGEVAWDTPASSSGDSETESPQAARGCPDARGGFEIRRKRRQRLHGLHGYVACAVVTAATSVAMQLEALPDDSPARTGAVGTTLATSSILPELLAGLARFLRSALTDAGAYVQEAIQSLTLAVGEPPRRPFEENDAWHLVCLMDLAILCFILATCLFAVAFAMMPRECEVGKELASGAIGSEDEQEEVVRPICRGSRMFMAVIFSALAGGVLNIKHRLLSALLCGL